MSRHVVALAGQDVRGFKSGVNALDNYLRRHATGNAEAGFGATHVILRAPDDPPAWPEVIGYFTLSMAHVPPDVVGLLIGRKVPGYPLPVALIGRLAVDRRAQGRRIGEALLVTALRYVHEASRFVACAAIVVDAKDQAAANFYARYGFHALGASDGVFPRRLAIPMGTVRELRDGDPGTAGP